MSIEYLGLSEINGPLVVLEGLQGAMYDEMVSMTVNEKEKRLGRIIEIEKDKAVVQVFEGTSGMALRNTHTRLSGKPMEMPVSRSSAVEDTAAAQDEIGAIMHTGAAVASMR